MREYIIYAIIFFFPLGVIISYLLRKEGLKNRFIGLIVGISLIMVISFPVTMQKMGIVFALLVYLLLMGGLTGYFVRMLQDTSNFQGTEESFADIIENKEELSNDIIIEQHPEIASVLELDAAIQTSPDSDTEKNELTTATNDESADIPEQETKSEIPEVKEIHEPELILESEVVEKSEEIQNIEEIQEVDEIQELQEIHEAEVYTQTNEELKTDLETSESVDLHSLITEPVKSPETITPPLDSEPDDIELGELPVIEIPDEPIPIEILETEQLEEEVLVTENESGETKPESDTGQDIEAYKQEITEDFIETQEEEQADSIIDVSLINDKQNELDTEIVSPGEEEPLDIEVVEIKEVNEFEQRNVNDNEIQQDNVGEPVTEMPRINEMIEAGFACKYENRPADAARYFDDAYKLSKDSELHYMLTMEMLTLFTDTGMYYEAEQVLIRYIGNANLQPDIMNKINLQLSYIRILSAELNRLGIPNTPVTMVPRWVRLSVSEKLGEEMP